MSVIGELRHDRKGRTTGRIKTPSRAKVVEQFIMLEVRFLRSPVFAVLDLVDRCVIDRLQLEHAAHGGRDNGCLPCRYADFVIHGIRKQSISRSLRKLQALGIVVCTMEGRKAYAEIPGQAAQYRLTFLRTKYDDATHDWQRITSVEHAKEVVAQAEHVHQIWLNTSPHSPRQLAREAYAKRKAQLAGKQDAPHESNGAKTNLKQVRI